MSTLALALMLAQVAESQPLPDGRGSVTPHSRLAALIDQVAQSGRVLTLAPQLDDGIRVGPGAPPLLAFRYLEGRQRGRFGGLDLVLDDAGH